jgi:hypothetical protein
MGPLFFVEREEGGMGVSIAPYLKKQLGKQHQGMALIGCRPTSPSFTYVREEYAKAARRMVATWGATRSCGDNPLGRPPP